MKSRVSKIVSCLFIVVMAMLSVMAVPALAQHELILPSGIVFIEVTDGAGSYFNTNLTGVPEGCSVGNKTYSGWCVDVRTDMIRSPAVHSVRLYSSLAAPGELAGEQWNMVNYILNHKQGIALDVQQAIWYFVNLDGDYTPTRDLAWAIINDTLANGNGYLPDYGGTLAVICYPVILFPGKEDTQVSIIEIVSPLVPGDINGDGKVNVLDIVIVALQFGRPPPPIEDPRADVNNDGKVNVLDVTIVANHFGKTES